MSELNLSLVETSKPFDYEVQFMDIGFDSQMEMWKRGIDTWDWCMRGCRLEKGERIPKNSIYKTRTQITVLEDFVVVVQCTGCFFPFHTKTSYCINSWNMPGSARGRRRICISVTNSYLGHSIVIVLSLKLPRRLCVRGVMRLQCILWLQWRRPRQRPLLDLAFTGPQCLVAICFIYRYRATS